MLKFTSAIIICLSVLTSCKTRESFWNADDSTFTIPSQKLSIQLPHNSDWVVADPSTLPENILFFGVIPSDGIGVYLFSEKGLDYKSVSDMSSTEIKQQIYPIFSQPSSESNVIYNKLETEKCTYLNKDALKFHIKLDIDNHEVLFSGYMFVYNKCLLKYVLSQPYSHEIKSGHNLNGILENSIMQY